MLAFVLLSLYAWFDWKTLKTDDFTVIYKKEYHWEALYALQNLEYYKDSVQAITGTDGRNLPVVIEDVGALSNGFADPLLHNIHVFTRAPDFASRMEGIENWYRAVTVHEYAHTLHLSRAEGLSKILANVFGSLFKPNIYSPGWITEGITVYCESQMTPYEGRLNDGFFDSYIGERVRLDAMPSIVEATNTPVDFPLGSYYLYGGEFFGFLAQTYGEEKFAEFFTRYGSCLWAPLSAVLPATGLDIAARRTYGKSFPALFNEWHEYAARQYVDWRTAGMQITHHGWYMYSLLAQDGKLYYVRYRPVKVDGFDQRKRVQLVQFDPGLDEERVLASLNSAITTPLRVHENKLYYTTPQLARGYANVYYHGFGVVANLHERDILEGHDRIMLTDDIRGFCVLPDGSILYSRDKTHGFGSQLWLFNEKENRMLFETELLVGELDANGKYVAAVARHDFENWNIYLLDLQNQELEPVVATPWIEGSIDLVAERLLFTANYEKIYAVHMCDLETGEIYQLTSNGYADHGVVMDSTLYFMGIHKDGYDLYRTVYKPRAIEPISNFLLVNPDFEGIAVDVTEGGYGDVLKTLVPAVHVPVLLPMEADLGAWAYGLVLLGGDATHENLYGGFLGREISDDDLIFNLLWQSRFFSLLDISFFYDYKDSFEYNIAFPAFINLEHGFSHLTLFLDGRIWDGLQRKEFLPGFALGFEYPYTTLSASFVFPFERQAWGSVINRNAQDIRLSVRQIVSGGELRVLNRAYIDSHNPDTPDFSIRGYDAIVSPRAFVVNVEYGHLLCRLRKGLWNPNVYVEDLFWTIFADYALTEGGTTSYSIGCELRLEAKTGFGFLQIVPKLGVALTKSKKIGIFFGLYPSLPI
jgi:hypothetical protein